MKRRDFINLSASVALLSCSKKSSPIEPVLEESDLRSAAFVLQAQTQATIEAQLPNDGRNHVGRLIYITDAVPVAATHCAFSWADYPCTVSDQDGGNSVTSTCSLPDTLVVAVGHQFDILSQAPCNGRLDLILTVKSPEALINLLIGEVQDLVESGVLDSGNGSGLLATLDQALTAITGDRPSAANLLNAFINQVEGFIAGGILTPAEGQALIVVAQFVIDRFLNG